jgi:hypothetical protein
MIYFIVLVVGMFLGYVIRGVTQGRSLQFWKNWKMPKFKKNKGVFTQGYNPNKPMVLSTKNHPDCCTCVDCTNARLKRQGYIK